MKASLIGPCPPPRGGVSVHLWRLAESLREQGNTVRIFDSNSKDRGGYLTRKVSHLLWLLQFLVCSRPDIWHIHVSEWGDRAAIIFLGRVRKIKTIVTFHSLRDDFTAMTFWQKQYCSYVINHANHLIAVGQNEKHKLLKHFDCDKRLSVLPAFVPPKRKAVELPRHIADYIRGHDLILSANASNMDFYQGQDIYGLDMLVELCGRLRTQVKVGLVYCLTHLTDPEYYNKMKARIKELELNDSILFVLDDQELWPILERSHIFIRPTCTDSYGVSVAEALMLGVPSIASDVCPRPKGTILFRSRDSEDLFTKVWDIVENFSQTKAQLQNLEFENCAPEIQRIYRKLLEQ